MTFAHGLRRSPCATAIVALTILLAPVAVACSNKSDGAKSSGKTTTTAKDGSTKTTDGGPDATTGEKPPPVTVSDDAQPYVDALIKASVESDNTVLPLNAEQAACIVPRWVDTLGDRLAFAQIAPDDFTAGAESGANYFDLIDRVGDATTAKAMVDAIDVCQVDLVGLVVDLVGTANGSTEKQNECMTKALPPDEVKKSLASAVDGNTSTSSDLSQPIQTAIKLCLPGGGRSGTGK